MTLRTALALAALGALTWIALGALALLLFASGCATVPAGHQVAASLRLCLSEPPRLRAQGERPLSLKCQCVTDAAERCLRAGLPAFCAWNGDTDADEGIEGAVTLLACFQRPECVHLGCDPAGKTFVVRGGVKP